MSRTSVLQPTRQQTIQAVRMAVMLASLLATGCSDGLSQKIVIPQGAIQKSVDSYFPISTKDSESSDKPVHVTLSDAIVVLNEGSDQIGFDVRITVELPSVNLPEPKLPKPALPGVRSRERLNPVARTTDGELSIFVGLAYKPAEGEFYCENPRITKLQTDDLPPQFEERVRKAVEVILTEYLSRNAVYTLTDDQTSTKLAKSTLKSVAVDDGQVYVEVGF